MSHALAIETQEGSDCLLEWEQDDQEMLYYPISCCRSCWLLSSRCNSSSKTCRSFFLARTNYLASNTSSFISIINRLQPVKIITFMSADYIHSEPNPETITSFRRTYFRLRELKRNANTLPTRPHRQTDLKPEPQPHSSPPPQQMRNTSINFRQKITLKLGSKEQNRQKAMRHTFYSGSKTGDNISCSAQKSMLGRTSLNFHQQNIFKDQSNNNYLNKYKIIKQLGKGSFSTVYLAEKQQKTNHSLSLNSETLPLNPESQSIYQPKDAQSEKQWVAIKVYQKFKMGKEPHKLKNIKKEITLMQNMQNEGVAKLYESVETLTKISLVVQYGGDQSLLQYVKQNHPLPMQMVKSIALQLIQAIAYLHSRNIVHRDIKLQNVLLHNGKTKLIDFGFSCLTHKLQKLTITCGTPNYMAPQVISRKDYIGEQADVWSYGVVVYAVAEGRHPFKADTYSQLQRVVNRCRYQLRRVKQQGFANFLKRILKVKGEERPSAKEILEMEWMQPSQE